MYGIMNLETRKLVASGFMNRQNGKAIRDEMNSKNSHNKHIIVRDNTHPKGASRVTDLTFKYWEEKK